MVCPHCACLGLRGLGADPLLVAYCSLLPKLLSQSPHGFQPSSPGPHELGGGSSFFMSPEAEDKPFLQSVVWRLPLHPAPGCCGSLQYLESPGTVWLLPLYLSGKGYYVGDTQMPT